MVRRDLYSAHVTCGKNSGLAPGGDHQYTNFSRTMRPSFHSWIATWVLFIVPHSAWSMSTRQTTNALLPETTQPSLAKVRTVVTLEKKSCSKAR